LARREKGSFCFYVTDEQRSQSGWIGSGSIAFFCNLTLAFSHPGILYAYNSYGPNKTRKSAREVDDPMPKKKNRKVEALSREILDYLDQHPDASDTLEGISTWWLEQQRIEQLVDEVADALELLIKRGAVKAQPQNNGITTYKIKKDNIK
jgi:hypothetical protein